MEQIAPIIRTVSHNNLLFLIGMSLLLVVLCIRIIFFKHYLALFNYNKYLQIKQNSAVYLMLISFFYSSVLAFLFFFLYKGNELSQSSLLNYFVVVLFILAIIIIQFFSYSGLWYVLKFKAGSLEVLYNNISYIKTWKILLFTCGFFLYYFSIIPNKIVINSILIVFGLAYTSFFLIFICSLKNHSVSILNAILYLVLIEVFPLLFLYNYFINKAF